MPSVTGVQTCALDRKSTRLNSSHTLISYAVFCLKKIFDDLWVGILYVTMRKMVTCARVPLTVYFFNYFWVGILYVNMRKLVIGLLRFFFLRKGDPPAFPLFPTPPPSR